MNKEKCRRCGGDWSEDWDGGVNGYNRNGGGLNEI